MDGERKKGPQAPEPWPDEFQEEIRKLNALQLAMRMFCTCPECGAATDHYMHCSKYIAHPDE